MEETKSLLEGIANQISQIAGRIEQLGSLIINLCAPKKSGTYAIFKGTGAAKFSIIPPRRSEHGFVDKNGAVLLEAAPAEGKRPDGLPNCNWDKKVTFAISVTDICNLLDSNPKKNKLFHQNERSGTTKSLYFQPGGERYPGTFMLYINEKGGADGERKVAVPFSNGEYVVLQRLLVGAVPGLLGWE